MGSSDHSQRSGQADVEAQPLMAVAPQQVDCMSRHWPQQPQRWQNYSATGADVWSEAVHRAPALPGVSGREFRYAGASDLSIQPNNSYQRGSAIISSPSMGDPNNTLAVRRIHRRCCRGTELEMTDNRTRELVMRMTKEHCIGPCTEGIFDVSFKRAPLARISVDWNTGCSRFAACSLFSCFAGCCSFFSK